MKNFSHAKGFLRTNKAINSERQYFPIDSTIQYVDSRIDSEPALVERQRFSHKYLRKQANLKQDLTNQEFMTNQPKAQSNSTFYSVSPERKTHQTLTSELPILYVPRIQNSHVGSLPSISKELHRVKQRQGLHIQKPIYVSTIDESDESGFENVYKVLPN